MLDTPSPEPSEADIKSAYVAHAERVWNILIPRSSVKVEVLPYGVKYLHPTKGYRTVGKRRFAIRGVM